MCTVRTVHIVRLTLVIHKTTESGTWESSMLDYVQYMVPEMPGSESCRPGRIEDCAYLVLPGGVKMKMSTRHA